MKSCMSCGKPFDTTFVVDGEQHHMKQRKRCLICFPYGASRADPLEVRRAKALRKQRAWVQRRRREDGVDPFKAGAHRKKQTVVDLVGGCQLCGYSRCLRAISFHHLGDKEKSLTLREFQHSLGALLPELRKCLVLCQNCHSEVHADLVDAEALIRLNSKFSALVDRFL